MTSRWPMEFLSGGAGHLWRRTGARLHEAFFAPVDARSLGLFRLLYCGSVAATLLLHSRPYEIVRHLLDVHPELFRPIRLFELLGVGPMPAEAFGTLRVALIAVLGAAAVGLATRWALIASGLCFFFYYGTIYSMNKPLFSDKVGYLTDSVIFVLWILSVSPQIGRWGAAAWSRPGSRGDADAQLFISGWPLKAALLMLVIPYFGAFWSKIAGSSFWIDGLTLQAALVEHAMSTGNEAGLWLTRHVWLCAALSTMTLLFEASFGVVLLIPRAAWLYAPVGLAMHAMIWAYMDKNYFMYFTLPYLALLRWPSAASVERPQVIRFPAGGPRQSAAVAFIVLLTGIHLAFIFNRREAWPFSAWAFFGAKKDYTDLVGYRLQGIAHDGSARWLAGDEIRMARLLINDYSMRQAVTTRDRVWISDQLARLIQHLPPESRRGLRSVVIVSRQARRTPDGTFESADSPFMEMATDAVPWDDGRRASP